MQVHILGGGVAGLGCALALVRRAHLTNIQIFEQASALQLPHRMGHGLMLMQNGVRALHALQAGHLLNGCTPLKQAIFRDAEGRISRTENLNQVYCMTRASLVQGLYSTLPREIINFSHGCASIELTTASVSDVRVSRINWRNGNALIPAPDDLVVGADGWRSTLCHRLNPGLARPVSRVREIVTSTDMPDVAALLGTNFIKTQISPGVAFGLLAPTPTRVIGFLQFDGEQYRPPNNCEHEIRQFLQRLLVDAPAPIPTYLRRADFSHAHVWHPINAELPAILHSNNAIAIGDAAHPMLPFSSQGVSAALEDAVLLAERLKAQVNGNVNLSKTLASFCQQRRQQILPYLEGGRKILDNFLAPSSEFVPSYVEATEIDSTDIQTADAKATHHLLQPSRNLQFKQTRRSLSLSSAA